MQHSDSISKLATALSKAQAEIKPAQMNAANPFLKNRFADLGAVIETARPVLAKYELAYTQFPINQEGQIGIETMLMHASGEWLSSAVFLPLGDEKGKSQAQVAGSVITYLRRYSLSAVLGIYADEDTDAQIAPRQPERQQPAPKVAPTAPASSPLTNGTNGQPVTRETFFAYASEHGVSKEASRIAIAHTVKGGVTDWRAAMTELKSVTK